MYNELYEIWRCETQSEELKALPSDFYSKVTDYLKKLKEESRMLDKRTIKARLLRGETQNSKRMLKEMLLARRRKLFENALQGNRISADLLTPEEERLFKEISIIAEAHQAFVMNLLQGRLASMETVPDNKNPVVRFLADVPALVGADMKLYGPFKSEDVASLPNENAKILIKQRLAEEIEAK